VVKHGYVSGRVVLLVVVVVNVNGSGDGGDAPESLLVAA